jgi:hypothetical protein
MAPNARLSTGLRHRESLVIGLILSPLISYGLVTAIYGDALRFLASILAFSLLPELDLLPNLLKGKKAARVLHGLPGLTVFSVGFSIGSLFCDPLLIQIMTLSTLVHYAVDFALRRTTPLFPFSSTEVALRDSPDNRVCDDQYGYFRKPKMARGVRAISDPLLLCLPLPRLNPNLLSGLSLLTSLCTIAVWAHSPAMGLVLLTITLLLDWFDGLIAKKHGLSSETGYFIDVMTDRISEGILAIPFFVPWFYLFVLNSILAVWSFATKRHIVLPLRHFLLVVLLITEWPRLF